MKNYSRQREVILQVLRGTDTHPTAGQVYERVRAVLPNVSLGTVYRNLAELTKQGDILSVSVGDGFEHFDGDNSPHVHLHCRRCGAIIDARMESDAPAQTAAAAGFTPETEVYVVYGICKDCKQAMIQH